jgi:uncharacterized membrane protein
LNLGALHPIVVHFAIAFVCLGVVLRLLSLLGRPAFLGPAASTLLLAGSAAVFLAVKSGHDAHGPVERVPGAYEAVKAHEDAGNVARNFIAMLALLEIAALALRQSRFVRHAHVAASVIGVGAVVFVLVAANRGGNLVYSYAGGVGIRSGAPEDVGNLLVAGLYHQAQQDRQAGRRPEAAALADLALRRFPGSIPVRLFQAESVLLDRQDPNAALAALGTITVPAADQRSRIRHGTLTAVALEAAGRPGDAKAALEKLAAEFPGNARLKARLGRN